MKKNRRKQQSDLPMVLVVLGLMVFGFLYFAFFYQRLQGQSGDFWRRVGALLITGGALALFFRGYIKVWAVRTVKKLKNAIGIF